MTPRKWQEQYLPQGADDEMFEYISNMLIRCPVCHGEGWITETVEGANGEPEPSQELCTRCFATGKIIAE